MITAQLAAAWLVLYYSCEFIKSEAETSVWVCLHSGNSMAPALGSKDVHMDCSAWHVFCNRYVTYLHAELLLDAHAQVQHQHLRLQLFTFTIIRATSRSLHTLSTPHSARLSFRVRTEDSLRCR